MGTYLWVSLDVSALYTSIQHEVGLRELLYFLTKSHAIHYKQAQFTFDCTKFTLEHNYFCFIDCYYLQTHRTAMGVN